MIISELVQKQRDFFRSGKTFSIEYRLQALKALKSAILRYEERLTAALHTDLGKSQTEAYMCEIGLTLSELGYVQKHLRSWARNRCVATSLANFHAKSFIVQEPYGVTLIMSPWNYPVLLTLQPLIGALAAGNCCVLKSSAYSPETSRVLSDLIGEIFPEEYVAVVQGGRQENHDLLEQKFDYIFFTGGVSVGKLVMEKAAQHLTPITLELGGKSPCIIDKTANVRLAARRIVFGKYLNCGQTCVAPDYVLIDKSLKDKFLQFVKEEIKNMYGANPLENPAFGKIVNRKHFDRLLGLIDTEKVFVGGKNDAEKLKIAPTVLDNVTPEDAVMQEEIFGPILPILSINSVDEAYDFVKSRPHPLALYLFTNDKKTERRFLREVPFGGGCVNDTIIHLASSNLPFGGVGESGMGTYHGKKTFETFSHAKSVVKKYQWIDLSLRYLPYTNWKQKLIRFFLK